MAMFKKPLPVEYSQYLPNAKSNELPAKYGLPSNVEYCRSCVISNQRPNSSVEFKHSINSSKSTINFDQNGVCDACNAAKGKASINWEEREAQLRELCDKYRRNDGHYDCLVPGSGGKDSFMQAHLLKYKYGMHPLTCTWAPHIYTDWGWKNHQAWLHAGFDNILFTPNPKVHRLITRLAVENIFHPFQPFILGQKNLAPKVASLYDIPLVFYGENEAEYGNPVADMNSAKRSWDYFSASNEDEIFLGGSTLSQLRQLGLSKVDWEPYLPIDPDKLEQKKIEVHYLGYYERWHPQSAYYYAVENGGFQAAPERTAGTYSTYNSIDDKIDDFHYYTTYIKFGIGRASYDAAQEIRSGDLMREEGVALVNKYDGEFPSRWADEIFSYLSINPEEYPEASKYFENPLMNRDYFDALSDTFRSPHLWAYDDGKWSLRHKVTNESHLDSLSVSSWVGNQKVR